MSIRKYTVRSTCLSCNRRLRGSAVAVVTKVREDNHEARFYLVHESCQRTMLRALPFDDAAKPDAVEEPTRP